MQSGRHLGILGLLLSILALLSSCSGAMNTTSPMASPTSTILDLPIVTPASTILPSESGTPTIAPVSVTAVLPAPLYVLAAGQIMRIERDGMTQTQITNEPAPAPDLLAIIEFDVAPTTDTLVYVVQSIDKPPILVRTDMNGNQRTVLLDDRSVLFPLLSPDGNTIAFSVFEHYANVGVQKPGLYFMPITGGEPRLILPNQAVTDPNASEGDSRGFSPGAWSPDGTKLLVKAFSLTVERCELAVVEVTSGAVTYFNIPTPDLVASCTAAAWSADSQTIYFNTAYPGSLINEPGIWQGDATSGNASALPLEPANVWIRDPFATSEQLYVFSAPFPDQATLDAEPYPSVGLTMHSVPLTGGRLSPLREDEHTLYLARWASDGSGAVIAERSESLQVRLLWLPAHGGATVELYRGQDVANIAWGKDS
ncbi:MAG: hypothetical protein K6356_08925 [Chloroflexus sp.]